MTKQETIKALTKKVNDPDIKTISKYTAETLKRIYQYYINNKKEYKQIYNILINSK